MACQAKLALYFHLLFVVEKEERYTVSLHTVEFFDDLFPSIGNIKDVNPG